ncbi:MAG: 4-hydroxy-tetrahydrodipicolinate reductase [Muribaculaceae bacterium]|nr:4-hydroxy-tetrahydrodipicolinate reductase [Muribaculaceae bacterium]MDE6343548.1 4-hydroxy-tetrahydrodipicolinate reductase [Muribaculaceae bacterium]MDE6502981.1 4-hydroxy-tetrahydrodipicolinate reductase [Muribaculaceae bacterium]MDE6609801.1 4-hydroxy-tetrahydrodipicolinate reductase [Muribaculaceae bacterium]
MKIALIGYGRMGHAIEKIALSRGHEIAAIVDPASGDEAYGWDQSGLKNAEVAIEFSVPTAAIGNYRRLMELGIPVVSGTTGWLDSIDEVKEDIVASDGTLFWTSNFSLGVNLFFAINKYAARLMASVPGVYTPSMKEIHHIHKLDHPSGTARSLAEDIVDRTPGMEGWTEDAEAGKDCLYIAHEREGEVPGTHIITWESEVDTITLEHRAHSREGFALGAVVAAEWIGKGEVKGFVEMSAFMRHLVADGKLLDVL